MLGSGARSRKAGDQEVRLNVGDDGEDDKYAKTEGRRWSGLRIILILFAIVALMTIYVMFVQTQNGEEVEASATVQGDPAMEAQGQVDDEDD